MRSALFILLLLGVVATARAQTCASCDGGTLDEPSRLCLPHQIGGASTASAPRPGKGRGKPLAATYRAMRNRLSVTVTLYDRERPTAEAQDAEMRRSVRAVLDAHENAKLEDGGTGVLPVGGDPTPGEAAWVSWSEGLTDHVALLWLLPRGPRWLKVSATYVRPPDNTGDAAEFAVGFVRGVTSAICRVPLKPHG